MIRWSLPLCLLLLHTYPSFYSLPQLQWVTLVLAQPLRMCFKYISELPFYPHLLPSFNVPSLSDPPPQTKLSPGMSCTSLIQFSPLFLTCSWKTCSKAPFFMRTTLQHCLNPTPPHFGMSCFFSHVLRA